MALRKCPGCKNIIAAETLTCPICGCNPRTRRLRKFAFWTAASVTTLVLVGTHLRQNASQPEQGTPPVQAVTAASR